MISIKRIALAALSIGVAATAAAQVQTGNIIGVVTDNDGLVLPGVLITLTPQQAQGIEQTAITNIRGLYRFPSLNLGTYTLTFKLEGFAVVIRETIRVQLGTTTNLPVTLEPAALADSVTVVGEAPVVDPKQTGTATNFGLEHLQNIPSTRDPWAILEQTPGVTLADQNVGGSRTGFATRASAHGILWYNNTWSVDGVNITDTDTGAPPMFFDFDAYEEIQIVTGGQDASVRTSGISINFVTKDGTNDFHGEGYWYHTDESFMSENLDAELEERGVGVNPAGLKRIYDYGFNLGGPILRDRLWFWFGYGVQNPDRYAIGFIDETQCTFEEVIFTPEVCAGPTDKIELENFNLKVNAQIAENNKATFLWSRGERFQPYGRAGPSRTVQSAGISKDSTTIYKIEDQHVVNDNFFFTAKFAYTDSKGGTFPRDGSNVVQGSREGLLGVQSLVELGTQFRVLRNNWGYGKDESPQYQFNFDTNNFVDQWAGASHEFKAGFEARLVSSSSFTVVPGGALGYLLGGEAWLIEVDKNGEISHGTDTFSFYAEDTMVFDKMTVNLGLRFDHQNGYHNPSVSPATQIDGVEFFPANSYAGNDSITRWINFLPRVGFTYDFSGAGTTIVRGNYARYVMPAWSDFGIPTRWAYSTYVWNDFNGDLVFQGDEAGAFQGTTFNFADPNFSPITVDPNLDSEKVDEAIFGIEHQLLENFSVGANYIYRYDSNWITTLNSDVELSEYVRYDEHSAFTGRTFDAWTYTGDGGIFGQVINAPTSGINLNYHGIEIVARKRWSDGWQLMGSLTLGQNNIYITPEYGTGRYRVGPSTSPNPNDREFLNGNPRFSDNRWVFKLTGSYQLPWGILASGFLNMRDGFPVSYRKWGEPPEDVPGRVPYLYSEPRGESRYDTMALFDWRVEKSFDLPYGRIGVIFDMFNTFNANTVLDVAVNESRGNFNNVNDYLSPRIFRLGIRYRF